MMNIYESKKQLRQKVLARAAKLEADYKKKSSRAITELLLTMEEFQKAKTVFCFVGRRNEVDTRDIIALCFEQGCRADARRLRRKPVSFDSAIPVEHFKKNLISPDSGETFCSRFAAKTDLIAAVLLCQIETTIGHRL